MDRQAEGGRYPGIDLFRGDQIRSQLLDIVHSGQAGHRHECQQPGNDKKQQVIAGIDRGKTEQERDQDIERSRFADLQAKGNAMPAMIVRITPPLSTVDISFRMVNRWEQTATAMPLTSSGAT